MPPFMCVYSMYITPQNSIIRKKHTAVSLKIEMIFESL